MDATREAFNALDVHGTGSISFNRVQKFIKGDRESSRTGHLVTGDEMQQIRALWREVSQKLRPISLPTRPISLPVLAPAQPSILCFLVGLGFRALLSDMMRSAMAELAQE